jgi:hypothetical protein
LRQIHTTAPLTGGGDLTADRTLAISTLAGDAGSGGAVGAAPAPGAGDAAAGKFLKADATWQVPPSATIWTGTTDPSNSLGNNGDLYVETGGSGSGGGFISPLSAQGDLYGRSASADVRIPVGTNGQLLTADSTQTTGVKWAAAPSGLPATPSDATQFLNGAATPAFAQVKDTDLALTDVTGNNVSTTKHGFVPKAPNDATKFLNGLGAWAAPASGSAVPFSSQFVSLTTPDANHTTNNWEDAGGMTITFTPTAVCNALALAQVEWNPSNSSWEMMEAQFVLDGVAQGSVANYMTANGANSSYDAHSFTLFCFLPALSAGSHTIKVQVHNGGSGMTYHCNNRQMLVTPLLG